MSEFQSIAEIPYPEFHDRVPRIDHKIRIGIKVVDLLYKNAVGNLRDLLIPGDEVQPTENRMEYVERRAEERKAELGEHVDSYVLEKGLGTEHARSIIRHRKAFQAPKTPEHTE